MNKFKSSVSSTTTKAASRSTARSSASSCTTDTIPAAVVRVTITSRDLAGNVSVFR